MIEQLWQPLPSRRRRPSGGRSRPQRGPETRWAPSAGRWRRSDLRGCGVEW